MDSVNIFAGEWRVIGFYGLSQLNQADGKYLHPSLVFMRLGPEGSCMLFVPALFHAQLQTLTITVHNCGCVLKFEHVCGCTNLVWILAVDWLLLSGWQFKGPF